MSTSAPDIVERIASELRPTPTALRFAWLSGGQRNALKFRAVVERTLSAPVTVDERWPIDTLTDKINALKSRIATLVPDDQLRLLDRFVTLYQSAYGGIVDDFNRWLEICDKPVSASNIMTLADCIQQTLMSHGNVAFEQQFELTPAEIANRELVRKDDAREESDPSTLLIKSSYHDNNGDEWSIPMLDLRIAPSDSAATVVESAMRALVPDSGYVLASGRSYHFYSSSAMTPSTFCEFAAKSLLLVPLTDSRFIGHSILDGEFSLRISPRKEYGGAPYLVSNW